MKATSTIQRIPEDELAEHWFGFKQDLLGELQRKYREQHITQRYIAERIGKEESVVSRCLRGQQNMTVRTMHDLARGMNCSLRLSIERLDDLPRANRPRTDNSPSPAKATVDGSDRTKTGSSGGGNPYELSPTA